MLNFLNYPLWASLLSLLFLFSHPMFFLYFSLLYLLFWRFFLFLSSIFQPSRRRGCASLCSGKGASWTRGSLRDGSGWRCLTWWQRHVLRQACGLLQSTRIGGRPSKKMHGIEKGRNRLGLLGYRRGLGKKGGRNGEKDGKWSWGYFSS